MHRLMAGVTILEHELSELRLLVERQTGILLDCPNSALAAHVAEYLENHELESPAALMGRLRASDQDPSALPTFLDGVLNVNTGFFRHPGAMNALARQVIPQLYGRKADDGMGTLRIWSAGCGTGEEAYSIAMALCETLPSGKFVEPLAAACEILDQVALPCGAEIAVLGDGKLGLLIALVLNAYGHHVHQFGRHAAKLEIASRAGVATEAASGTLPDMAYDWVVDATGSPEGLRQAVRMTRPRGTVILKSTVHGLVGVDTAPVIVNEITLVGSRCGRFEPALDLLSRNLIPVEEMISERLPLADAPRAFERAAQKGVLKVLLG